MKYAKRVDKVIPLNKVKYVLGFDINSDNIAWCLVDQYGNVIEWDIIDFRRFRTQGVSGKVCRTYVMEQLHILFTRFVINEELELAVGVEKREVLCALKLAWIKSGERKGVHYNYWVSIFRPRIMDDIEQIACKYGVHVIPVEPRGTSSSEEHREVMKKLRVNRHVASAYLVALRALAQLKQRKNIQTYP